MYIAFLISILSVTSIVSILITIQRRKNRELSMELFPFTFKYVGGALVIISIFMSLFELQDEELFTSIRIIIANSGLIIIALSKDKRSIKDSIYIKLACFTLSTFIFYLANHLMILIFGVEKIVELSQLVFYLLISYLISYHYIRSKFTKGARGT